MLKSIYSYTIDGIYPDIPGVGYQEPKNRFLFILIHCFHPFCSLKFENSSTYVIWNLIPTICQPYLSTMCTKMTGVRQSKNCTIKCEPKNSELLCFTHQKWVKVHVRVSRIRTVWPASQLDVPRSRFADLLDSRELNAAVKGIFLWRLEYIFSKIKSKTKNMFAMFHFPEMSAFGNNG